MFGPKTPTVRTVTERKGVSWLPWLQGQYTSHLYSCVCKNGRHTLPHTNALRHALNHTRTLMGHS